MRYAPRDGLPARDADIPVAGHMDLFVVRAFKLGRLGCQLCLNQGFNPLQVIAAKLARIIRGWSSCFVDVF